MKNSEKEINLYSLVEFLEKYLNIDNYKDDIAINGLQVEGKKNIKKIITGVTASYELFEKAIENKADAILVHHGILFSKKSSIIKGSIKKRLYILLQHDISLLAYHLPLDTNENLGNNIKLIEYLGLNVLSKFATYNQKKIGYIAYSKEKKNLSYFITQLKLLSPNNHQFIFYPFGKEYIEKIGIVSGAGSSFLEEAIENHCDLIITGEVKESTLHIAKEEKINFLSIGHYNSEKLGISSLGEFIKNKYNILHKFIDVPNKI